MTFTDIHDSNISLSLLSMHSSTTMVSRPIVNVSSASRTLALNDSNQEPLQVRILEFMYRYRTLTYHRSTQICAVLVAFSPVVVI